MWPPEEMVQWVWSLEEKIPWVLLPADPTFAQEETHTWPWTRQLGVEQCKGHVPMETRWVDEG